MFSVGMICDWRHKSYPFISASKVRILSVRENGPFHYDVERLDNGAKHPVYKTELTPISKLHKILA